MYVMRDFGEIRVGGGEKVSGGAVTADDLERTLCVVKAALAERKRAMDLRLNLEAREQHLRLLREEMRKARPQEIRSEIDHASREASRSVEQ
ncbi:hypothetical protein Pmar_PMAR011206, partial [Perkinsus marinus ATCC 50983]